jgi:1,2-phenylacetyl-CoA epoxidase PaaB subunit
MDYMNDGMDEEFETFLRKSSTRSFRALGGLRPKKKYREVLNACVHFYC